MKQKKKSESLRHLINLNSISCKQFLIPSPSFVRLMWRFIGKGDLVGCDISLNLLHNGQLTGGGGQGGQDFILKSSSDVKVGQSMFH